MKNNIFQKEESWNMKKGLNVVVVMWCVLYAVYEVRHLRSLFSLG